VIVFELLTLILFLGFLTFAAGALMVVAAAIKLVLWLVLLPFRLLFYVVLAPFYLLKWVSMGVLGLILVPVLALVVVLGAIAAVLAIISAIVVPLLPLLLVGVAVWAILQVARRPAPA
jgi:hypothetical protein